MPDQNESCDESLECGDAADAQIPTQLVVALFLSGAAALVYEVVWTRELALVFGSTAYAVSTMLASFMTGLSIGSFLGGRRADAAAGTALSDLGRIELTIGAVGAASIVGARVLPTVQDVVLGGFEPHAGLYFAGQMTLAFLVLLIPTTLMGATFPLASRIAHAGHSSLGRTVGKLYAIHNVGAVMGALASGFLLMPLLGVRATLVAAVIMNVTGSFLLKAMAAGPALPIAQAAEVDGA